MLELFDNIIVYYNQMFITIKFSDLSLILGSMARGRSFSTTVNPKMNEIISPPSNQSQSNLHASGKAASVGSIDATMVVRRKKSEPNTAREK